MTIHTPIQSENRFIDMVRSASMSEQMSILSWILNGTYARQSDEFVDALTETVRQFEADWDRLSAIAEPCPKACEHAEYIFHQRRDEQMVRAWEAGL